VSFPNMREDFDEEDPIREKADYRDSEARQGAYREIHTVNEGTGKDKVSLSKFLREP